MHEEAMHEDAFTATLLSRRELMARMGTGLAALTVATALGPFSPARARGVPLKPLGPREAATLDAWNDTLVPGAAAAGVLHFLDDQLGKEVPLLMLRYTDFPGAPLDFYREGAAALDGLSQARYQRPFAALDADARTQIVGEVAGGKAPNWSGPPAPLFYFVTRADAVDVSYGTEEGFARLALPYMPHITPPKAW